MHDAGDYTKEDELDYWVAVEDALFELWINDPPQPDPWDD